MAAPSSPTPLDRGRALYRSLTANPVLLPLVVSTVRRPQRTRLAGANTDIVIDGFPRSANTFAVHAFRRVNPDASIAHHLHCAGQLRRGVRLGLPTVLIVRDPLDAAVSEVIRDGRRSLAGALDDWIHLHRHLMGVLGDIVVAPFDRVTSDYGSVIEQVNDRYGTAFVVYRHSPTEDAAVLASVQNVTDQKWSGETDRALRVPRPSEQRGELRREILATLAAPTVAARAEAAQRLHQQLLVCSGHQR